MSEDKKLKVKVPSEIVRNELFSLNNGEFLTYARLSFLWFRNYECEEIPIDHKKFMLNLGIVDTRTLKKRLDRLYELNLIKTKIDRFPRKGETMIEFNGSPFESKHFTMLPASIFNYVGTLDEHSIRLLFYYKSYINKNDKDRDRSFCFVGYKKIMNDLHMSPNTIEDANKMLVKNKMLKIIRHKIETEYEYGKDDELVFDRWNNHYYINDEKI